MVGTGNIDAPVFDRFAVLRFDGLEGSVAIQNLRQNTADVRRHMPDHKDRRVEISRQSSRYHLKSLKAPHGAANDYNVPLGHFPPLFDTATGRKAPRFPC